MVIAIAYVIYSVIQTVFSMSCEYSEYLKFFQEGTEGGTRIANAYYDGLIWSPLGIIFALIMPNILYRIILFIAFSNKWKEQN